MVDSFAETRPDAVARFTCWEQYTNRRYTNEGEQQHFTITTTFIISHKDITEDYIKSLPLTLSLISRFRGDCAAISKRF
jgi:hypothetical protein